MTSWIELETKLRKLCKNNEELKARLRAIGIAALEDSPSNEASALRRLLHTLEDAEVITIN